MARQRMSNARKTGGCSPYARIDRDIRAFDFPDQTALPVIRRQLGVFLPRFAEHVHDPHWISVIDHKQASTAMPYEINRLHVQMTHSAGTTFKLFR
jgi:hypothetical protein